MLMQINKFRKTLKGLAIKEQGFTIVELLVALSILLIVLTLSYTFYSFGTTTFRIGETQADVQQNGRLAANFITKEVRICERVVIVDGYAHAGVDNQLGGALDVEDLEHFDQSDVDESSHLYHLFLHDGLIYHQRINGIDEPRPIVQGITDKVTFDLEFSPSQAEQNLLKFNVLVNEIPSGRDYLLETEVLALNTEIIEDFRSTGSSGSAIFYLVPAPPEASIISIAFNRELIDVFADPGINEISVSVKTVNVPDGAAIFLELFRFTEVGPHDPVHLDAYSILGFPPEISFNLSEFTLSLVADQLEINGFYFGEYFTRISVEEVTFPLRRNLYLLADLYELNITQRGQSHVSRVNMATRGVAPETEVIAVEGIPEGLSGKVEISLIDSSNEEQVPFTISSGNTIDPDGKAIFNLQLVNSDDSSKNIRLITSIGKTTDEILNVFGYEHLREVKIVGTQVTISTTGLNTDAVLIDIMEMRLLRENDESQITQWPSDTNWIVEENLTVVINEDIGEIIFDLVPENLPSETMILEVTIGTDVLASYNFSL